MKKIKVAHVVTKLELGGAQQNTLHTVRFLDRNRFEPLLVCGEGGVLDADVAALDARVVFVPALRREVLPSGDLVAGAALRRLFKIEKPDIVHTHSSKAGIVGRWAARAAGVPKIVHTYHGFGFTPASSPWVKRFYITLERRTASFSDALIFVSESNREEARTLGIGSPARSHLIRSGIALSDYRSVGRHRDALPAFGLNAGDPMILTVGPFKPQKNLRDFVRAAQVVKARYPDSKFFMIGDGAGRERLEKSIQERGLEKNVILLGWRRDVPVWLARADVFCLTSLWEGLPRALVEAMAAGVPSVVNAVDGCRDVIREGENGFLVPPRHPLTTADRLLTLLGDPALSRRFGEAARVSVGEEFDIDRMVRSLERLYATIP